MAEVGIKPPTSDPRVRDSTTRSPRSPERQWSGSGEEAQPTNEHNHVQELKGSISDI